MDTGRSGVVCRRFMNGSCRYGSRCIYSHVLPVLPSAQICRYYQKGGCWFRERCRFLHVLESDVNEAAASRRGSVPVVSSSSASYAANAQPVRRGSEPTLPITVRQEWSRGGISVNVANSQHSTRHRVLGVAQEQLPGTGSSHSVSGDLVQSSDIAVGTSEERNEQNSSDKAPDEGAAAAAAASGTQVKGEETSSFLQSKDVTCGICMDKVYEKMNPGDKVFGILPNCNHSFCLQCIMTWRKTKEFGPDVVKSCPQCRVRSPFYVPHRQWVEGQEKESLIAAFKEKCSKKNCGYYARYRCCPFKTECLYRHNPSHHRSFRYPIEDDEDYDGIDLLNFFIAMTLLSGDDDDEDFEDYEFPFDLDEEYEY
ncbi:makorin, ring finger protein, 4 [Cynoglossus semilaevis]|uniref:makorin, ring finger protein, 4 n=1 Tax=Cynoglossus semilaevis TaxID=244447 RepID=UPI00049658D0|nr:probable E3 ubiquitin-protein ligase makorin-1 [Cynoglossus semilaevis]